MILHCYRPPPPPVRILLLDIGVDGLPLTKGSVRGFAYRKANGKLGTRMVNDCRRDVKGWQNAISARARESFHQQPWDGPVHLTAIFSMPRPKGHFKKTEGYTKSAPVEHGQKPDIDKLLRVALDALTGIIYADDAQVAVVQASKHWVAGRGPGGLALRVTTW